MPAPRSRLIHRTVEPGKNQKLHLDVRAGEIHTAGADRRKARSSARSSGLPRGALAARRASKIILDDCGIDSAALARSVDGGHGQAHRPSLLAAPLPPMPTRIEGIRQGHANVTRDHRCKNRSQLLDAAARDPGAWRRRASLRPIACHAA
jgi:hypothetical protein